jgi:hypothetical protein
MTFGLISWGRSKRLKRLEHPSYGLHRAGEREAPLSPSDLGSFMEEYHVIYSPSSWKQKRRNEIRFYQKG